MENNNKDKPVRVRITGCFDQVSAWYRDLIGREYEVTDYLELWYKVRDYQLIYKLDCEVISPEPESKEELMKLHERYYPIEGEKAEDLKTFIDEICEEAKELAMKLVLNANEKADMERLYEIIDELKYFKNLPAKSEAWATDEDIIQAYAEGHARYRECEESELQDLADNYLQSLKNKKA